jgi:hypothetical protein
MKIAKAFRIVRKLLKEARIDEEYVWPSPPPSFPIKVATKDGQCGIGENQPSVVVSRQDGGADRTDIRCAAMTRPIRSRIN